jgi:hypothetical protein
MKLKLNKDYLILFIILLTTIFYVLFFISASGPFRNANFDAQCHVAMLKGISAFFENSVDNYSYPSSWLSDPRMGLNYILIYILQKVTQLDNTDVFLIIGILNITILIISAYIFSRVYYKNRSNSLFLVLIILIFGTTYKYIGVSYTNLTDLVFVASYPAVYGFGSIFLAFFFYYKYLQETKTKNLIIASFLLLVLLNNHFGSGIFLILLVFLFTLSEIINKKVSKKELILIILSFLIILFIDNYWFFSSWLQTSLDNLNLFQSSAIISGDYSPISPTYFLSIIRFTDLGFLLVFSLIILIKKKELFLLISIPTCFIISISLFLPNIYQVPLSWRLLPLLKILILLPMPFLFREDFIFKKRHFRVLILFFVLLIALLGSINANFLKYATSTEYSPNLSFINQYYTPNQTLFIIDTRESCFIQTITNYKILTVSGSTHLADPKKIIENENREKDFLDISSNITKDRIELFNEKYNNPLLLLNKRNKNLTFIPDYAKYKENSALAYIYNYTNENRENVLYEDKDYLLFRFNDKK